MATKIKSLMKMEMRDAPIHSKTERNKNGTFTATATINGKEYKGSGNSERLATIQMREKVDIDVRLSDVPTR